MNNITSRWSRDVPASNTRRRFGIVFFAVLAIVFVMVRSVSASGPASLSSEQIVSRLVAMDAKRVASMQAYTAIRHYTLDYIGFPSDKHAEMIVQVVSVPPRKQLTIVSQSGSNFLLKRVLRKLVDTEREANDAKTRQDVKLTPDNYDFQLLGEETVQDRECYVLHVRPKKNNKLMYVGDVWVDAEEFAVVRILAKPAKNPSFWISAVQIEHRYQKEGELWLPQTNRSSSKVRLGGRALLTIDYDQYELTDQDVSTAPLR